MKFSIRMHGVDPETGKELAGTDYSDHATIIARAMFNLYSYRINVYRNSLEALPQLVEYFDWVPSNKPEVTRIAIDPRTGEPYA